MGKKSRMKREAAEVRSHRSVASVRVPPRVLVEREPVMTQDEIQVALAIELHDQVEHLRLLKLNDEPFSHPDNQHKIDKTFKPMFHWLDEQERTGESDAMPDGTVILQPEGETEWYPVADAFRSVADTYELVAKDQGVEFDGEGLRKLANMIDYGMPLTQREVDAARKSLAWMKSVTLLLTPTEFSNFTTAIMTRQTLVEMGIL